MSIYLPPLNHFPNTVFNNEDYENQFQNITLLSGDSRYLRISQANMVKGQTGFTEPQGIQGFTGPQKIQGFTGPHEIQEFTGDTRFTGPQRIQGFTGTQGIEGFTGP